jgi:hypothetical protein
MEMSSSKPKVLITRPLPDNEFISAPLQQFCSKFEVTAPPPKLILAVPTQDLVRLADFNLCFRNVQVVLGPTQEYMGRDEVLRSVSDVDAIICHGKDRADAEVTSHAT